MALAAWALTFLLSSSPMQREGARPRASSAGITFTQMNGADFKPGEPHSLNLASCLGASWIFEGYANTLESLISAARFARSERDAGGRPYPILHMKEVNPKKRS